MRDVGSKYQEAGGRAMTTGIRNLKTSVRFGLTLDLLRLQAEIWQSS